MYPAAVVHPDAVYQYRLQANSVSPQARSPVNGTVGRWRKLGCGAFLGRRTCLTVGGIAIEHYARSLQHL